MSLNPFPRAVPLLEKLLGDTGDGWSNDDWATPWEVIWSLEAEFGPFDLDPCATRFTAKAPRFFTKAENGLAQPWEGRVFCNPPYSHKGPWLRKAYESSLAGAFVVCLVPARTDAAWFHDWILGKAELRFQRRRIVFLDGEGRPYKRPKDGTIYAIYRPPIPDKEGYVNQG